MNALVNGGAATWNLLFYQLLRELMVVGRPLAKKGVFRNRHIFPLSKILKTAGKRAK